jgi:tRNA pseudouridine38-40 synthase
MTVAYDGTNYCGWQVQPNGESVQAAIERAILKLTGEQVSVLSAGRTDSGVHALGQVVSFRTSSPIPGNGLRKALQKFLQPDVIIRDLQDTHSEFHATYSARKKRYRYVIHNSRTHNPFLRNYVWHRHSRLDSDAMHDAAQELIGRFDFRSFESHWPNKATSVRTVMELTVRREGYCPIFFERPGGLCGVLTSGGGFDAQSEGEFIWIEIVADGFLYNMVRAIVGTLLHVGTGRWDSQDIRRIRDAMDRSQAGDTAPPQGLYLVEVDYGDNDPQAGPVLSPESRGGSAFHQAETPGEFRNDGDGIGETPRRE